MLNNIYIQWKKLSFCNYLGSYAAQIQGVPFENCTGLPLDARRLLYIMLTDIIAVVLVTRKSCLRTAQQE